MPSDELGRESKEYYPQIPVLVTLFLCFQHKLISKTARFPRFYTLFLATYMCRCFSTTHCMRKANSVLKHSREKSCFETQSGLIRFWSTIGISSLLKHNRDQSWFEIHSGFFCFEHSRESCFETNRDWLCFETQSGSSVLKHSRGFEFTHRNNLLVYRVFFRTQHTEKSINETKIWFHRLRFSGAVLTDYLPQVVNNFGKRELSTWQEKKLIVLYLLIYRGHPPKASQVRIYHININSTRIWILKLKKPPQYFTCQIVCLMSCPPSFGKWDLGIFARKSVSVFGRVLWKDAVIRFRIFKSILAIKWWGLVKKFAYFPT